jgi:hypothetical protein
MVAFSKKKNNEFGFVYLFEEPRCRASEENFLLGQVNKGELSMDEYYLAQHMAGVFGILSDLDIEPQVVFEQYMAREEILRTFDFMVHNLEADMEYLDCEEALEGYFVVAFLAMQLYFKILARLREQNLIGLMSVWEVLFTFSKVRLIVEESGRESLGAVSKKTEQILEIFSDLIKII